MIEARRRLRLGASLLVLAVLIAAAVTFVGEPPFDRPLVHDAARLRGGWFGELMHAISEVGYARWLIPAGAVVALGFGVRLGRWRDGLLVLLGVTVASLVTRLLKETFERARPDEGGAELLAAGFSMPSGHATSAAAFAASLIIATRRGGRAHRVLLVAAPLFALLDGLSRVVLGVHYPSDVVAGYCSGTGVTLLVAGAIGLVPPRARAARRAVE